MIELLLKYANSERIVISEFGNANKKDLLDYCINTLADMLAHSQESHNFDKHCGIPLLFTRRNY